MFWVEDIANHCFIIEGKSTESGQKASDTKNASNGKDSAVHHHKSVKEKITGMLHHH